MKTTSTLLFSLFQTVLTIAASLTSHNPQCKAHPVFKLYNITYSDSTIYSTPAHLAVSDGSISFTLANTAVPYETQCSASTEQYPDFFYGNIVYPCTVPDAPGLEGSTNFTFSRADGKIEVNSTWSCQHGYGKENFLGFGSGNAVLKCNETVWTNPNWTLGELYQTYFTNCAHAELDITPTTTRIGQS